MDDPVCPCGYENFERVVVQHNAGAPIVTDFVACVGCRAVYHSPLGKQELTAPLSPAQPPPPTGPQTPRQKDAFLAQESNVPEGWIDAAIDSAARLKADAEAAAKDYRKPGRSSWLGPGGRR